MRVRDVISLLEAAAPLEYQDSYDNAGLQVGDPMAPVTGILVTLDVTPEVLRRAALEGCSLVVSHHPLLFRTPRTLTGRTPTERMTMTAIREGIAVYSAHTNLDNAPCGVSFEMAGRIGLQHIRVLRPLDGGLLKLTVHVPLAHADRLEAALMESGCGRLGGYGMACYRTQSEGAFMAVPMDAAEPGASSQRTHTREVRLETVVPSHLRAEAERVLRATHPYREPAFDFMPLSGPEPDFGSGVIGTLPSMMDQDGFLSLLREVFHTEDIAYTPLEKNEIRNIALVGGAGSFLLEDAIRKGCDAFVTGEIPYHEYFRAEGAILLASVGHFESEQYTVDLMARMLRDRFPEMSVVTCRPSRGPVLHFH